MKSVAIITASPQNSGIAVGDYQLSVALGELGYSVRWYQCLDRGQRPYLPTVGAVVHGANLPVATIDMAVNRLWSFPRKLRDVSEDIRFLSDPSLIRAGSGYPVTVARVYDLRPLSAYADRVATRLTFQYAIPRLRNLARVIVATHAAARGLVEYGVSPACLRTVPETTDLGYHPEHRKESMERITATGNIRFLCISTDRSWKNIELVIRLAAGTKNRQKGPDYRFTLVSRLGPKNQRLVRQLGAQNLTVLAGVPSVGSLYRDHDVLLFPSLFEGFGRPLIEAMAFGMPILAYRTPSAEEVLGEAGVLMESKRWEDWSEAIDSIGDLETFSELALKSLARSRAFSPDGFRTAVRNAFDGL